MEDCKGMAGHVLAARSRPEAADRGDHHDSDELPDHAALWLHALQSSRVLAAAGTGTKDALLPGDNHKMVDQHTYSPGRGRRRRGWRGAAVQVQVQV